MATLRHSLSWACSSALTLVLCGCPSAGLYRSARTLEPSETDLGLNLDMTRAAWAASSWYNGADNTKKAGGNATFWGAPEVHAHHGIVPDLEAGGRIAFGGPYAELDAKYRFLHSGSLHLAVAPLGGWTPGGALRGGRIALPLLATWDFDEHWGVSAGLHGGYRWARPNPVSVHVQPGDIGDLRWAAGSGGWNYGAGLSADWRGDHLYVRPAVELTRSSAHTPGSGADYGIDTWTVTLSAGWTFGRDTAAMDKTRQQLDALLRAPQ